MEQTTVACFHY